MQEEDYVDIVREALAELRVPATGIEGSEVIYENLDREGEVVFVKAQVVHFMVNSYATSHTFFTWDEADRATLLRECLDTLSEDVCMRLAVYFPTIGRMCRCPGCKVEGKTYRSPLYDIIMHLNDNHEWSREQIADWLETLMMDLSIERPAQERGLPGMPLAVAGTNPLR